MIDRAAITAGALDYCTNMGLDPNEMVWEKRGLSSVERPRLDVIADRVASEVAIRLAVDTALEILRAKS